MQRRYARPLLQLLLAYSTSEYGDVSHVLIEYESIIRIIYKYFPKMRGKIYDLLVAVIDGDENCFQEIDENAPELFEIVTKAVLDVHCGQSEIPQGHLDAALNLIS